MRALLAHSVLRLALVVALSASITTVSSAQVPLPIGPVSDYGNVLDRHGRERVAALIEDARDRHNVSVWLLVSWENPYDTAEQLADHVFRIWQLDSSAGLLAVFVRSAGTWDLGIVAGTAIVNAVRNIEARLGSAMRDLTEHARIEEAINALFRELDEIGGAAHPAQEAAGTADGGLSPGALMAIVLGVLGVLAVFAHRRICPRCGRILRVAGAPDASGIGARDRVYYCRRCHYRRKA